MARKFWRSRLILRLLALLCGGATFAASASAQAPAYITQWGRDAGPGQLQHAQDVAIGGSGNVYVLDASFPSQVKIYTSTGAYLSQWATPDFAIRGASSVTDLEVDAADNVYLSYSIPHFSGGRIARFSSDGVFMGEFGCCPSPPDYERVDGLLGDARGVTVDANGNFYIAEWVPSRIEKFGPNGVYIAKWGSLGSGDGQFNTPMGVATDALGNVYVADSENNRIQKFTGSGNYVTQWGGSGSGEGQLNHPFDVAIDQSGNVYVADVGNYRIEEFTSNGDYITQWGSFGAGNGQFHGLSGVAVDGLRNVYVAEQDRIQKFGLLPTPKKPTTWGRLKRLYR